MTVLIHDGPLLNSISRWGETLNDPEEISNKKIRETEHAYYIDGLTENGDPTAIDVRHVLSDGFHQYMVPKPPEQKFFFEGRRVAYYSCVIEDCGPQDMITRHVHQCQVWKDPLFQRNCRGFATKFMFKLVDQYQLITCDYAQTYDGMNLAINFLQYAINSQQYNCFYLIADREFDEHGKELPKKRYVIKVESLADLFSHYCQNIMGDDPVFVYRMAGATIKDKSLSSIIVNPDITEILTCKQAEEKGIFEDPQPFEKWPNSEKEKFSSVYVDV